VRATATVRHRLHDAGAAPWHSSAPSAHRYATRLARRRLARATANPTKAAIPPKPPAVPESDAAAAEHPWLAAPLGGGPSLFEPPAPLPPPDDELVTWPVMLASAPLLASAVAPGPDDEPVPGVLPLLEPPTAP